MVERLRDRTSLHTARQLDYHTKGKSMTHETYANLVFAAEKRKRAAAKTGAWDVVAEMCTEIEQIKAQYSPHQQTTPSGMKKTHHAT